MNKSQYLLKQAVYKPAQGLAESLVLQLVEGSDSTSVEQNYVDNQSYSEEQFQGETKVRDGSKNPILTDAKRKTDEQLKIMEPVRKTVNDYEHTLRRKVSKGEINIENKTSESFNQK